MPGFKAQNVLSCIPVPQIDWSKYPVESIRDLLREMREPPSIVGRVVMLLGIVARPELNSRYANVLSYDENTDRFTVKLLSVREPPEMLTVKRSKFEFVHPRRFPATEMGTNFISLSIEQLNSIVVGMPQGFHLATVDSLIINVPETSGPIHEINFALNGLIRGILGDDRDARGLYVPKSRMSHLLAFNLPHPMCCIEIEDLFFDVAPSSSLRSTACIYCWSGRIIFRRCRFKAQQFSVMLCQIGEEDAADVVFENCVFDSPVGVEWGKATFLNCSFCKFYGTAVEGKPGARVSLDHCFIGSVDQGLRLTDCSLCEVSNCVFDAVDAAIQLRGGKGEVSDCLVSHARTIGVHCERMALKVIRCSFVDCVKGVYASSKLPVDVTDCQMTRCSVGVYVSIDKIGAVNVQGCSYTSVDRDIEHNGLNKCSVKVDGRAFAPNGSTLALHLSNPEEFAQQLSSRNNLDLVAKRSLKSAGVDELGPDCAHCGVKERKGVKFKKCSSCLNAVYCSQECQVPLT